MMHPSRIEWVSTDRFSDALRRSTSVALPKSVPAFSKNLPTWVRWSDGRRRSTSPTTMPLATSTPTSIQTVFHRSVAPEEQPTQQREAGRDGDRATEVVAPERHAHHHEGDHEEGDGDANTPRVSARASASRPASSTAAVLSCA